MPRFCAHLGYLFTDRPLTERFAAAAAAGFAAVEHPDPYGMGIDAFARAAARHRLPVAQIAAPAGDAEAGEKGLACLDGRQHEFRRSVEAGIDAAAALGTTLLHVMPGILPDGATRKQCEAVYLENLAWAADRCGSAGLTVLIEAISDETVAGFYVNHPDYALELRGRLGRDNVRLLFDVYHAAVKGLDPIGFLERHVDAVGHIQIADHPGRHEPGTGRVPYAALFGLIDDLGYAGWVGCEYKPAAATEDGLGWMDAV